MEINYVDSDCYFKITDRLKNRGVVDTGTVINIETVTSPEGSVVYRAWYWETEESEKIRKKKKKEAGDRWKKENGIT